MNKTPHQPQPAYNNNKHMAQVGPYGQPYGQPAGYGGAHPGYGMPPGGQYGQAYPVTSQPMPINNVTIITGQQNAMNQPDNPKWQIGLCDCFNSCGTCALVFFCEPIAECVAANKINENCCYPAFCPGGVIPISVRFRTLHRIEMGMCEEACCWTFCRMCMLCRLLNEMRVRGHN